MITWDEAKRQANLDKHGLDFLRVPMVLESPFRMELESDRNGEARRQVFAYVFEVLAVLSVVCLPQGDAIRIISFRRASPAERENYHDWLENDFNDAR